MSVRLAAAACVGVYLALALTVQLLYGPLAVVAVCAVMLGPLGIAIAMLPWPDTAEGSAGVQPAPAMVKMRRA